MTRDVRAKVSMGCCEVPVRASHEGIDSPRGAWSRPANAATDYREPPLLGERQNTPPRQRLKIGVVLVPSINCGPRLSVVSACTATTYPVISFDVELIIGSGVYIGPNRVISMGAAIGDRAVIGAMSFVSRDVAGGTKAWGVPAKVIP